MRKLLIKLNIFALLLILPLQGYAAAGLVLCHKMNGGLVAQAMQNATAENADRQNGVMQSADMPVHCHTASEDIEDSNASNSICPHCFTCGIYAPALLTGIEPLAVQFDGQTFYKDFQSRFTSFIPQSPLHPPSVV